MALTMGCVEDLSVETPDFQVAMDSSIVKAGEEVIFLIEGSPDFITFYSGEDGHRYKYRNRTQATGTPTLSFESSARYGTGANTTLQIMASSDLSGAVGPEAVGAANWTDITSSYTLDTDRASENFVGSGEGDLSDYLGQPVFLAFKFTGTTGATQGRWRIRDLFVALTTEDGEVINVADIGTPGFISLDIAGEGYLWSWKNSFWEIAAGNDAAPDNEDWLVTAKPLNLLAVLPDKGMSQNSFTDKVSEIPHTYEAPGTYTVTFIGINATVDDAKEVVREITFQVQ